jgi:hypothetical protein
MRRLAREATAFALLGFLLASISLFAKLERDIKIGAKRDAARAVHAVITDPSQIDDLPPGYTAVPIGTVEVPLTNGTVLHVRQCADAATPAASGRTDNLMDRLMRLTEEEKDCRYFSDPYSKYGEPQQSDPLPPGVTLRPLPGRLTSVTLGAADQIAIEKDYWAAYSEANRQDFLSNGAGALLSGLLWGFPGRIGVWIFYQLVRFAVKG